MLLLHSEPNAASVMMMLAERQATNYNNSIVMLLNHVQLFSDQ